MDELGVTKMSVELSNKWMYAAMGDPIGTDLCDSPGAALAAREAWKAEDGEDWYGDNVWEDGKPEVRLYRLSQRAVAEFESNGGSIEDFSWYTDPETGEDIMTYWEELDESTCQ